MRTGYTARYGGLSVVAAMLAAASRGIESMGQAVSIARQGFDDFASAVSMLRAMPIRQGHRRGRGSRRLPTGRPGWIAPFATQADADRAIRRAERWMRANPNANFRDDAPSHIVRNYNVALDGRVMPAPAQ